MLKVGLDVLLLTDNFLVKLYNELTPDQKIKFGKNLQVTQVGISKTG